MPYIVAIDQGGTKTDVLVADDKGKIISFSDDRDQPPVEGERRAKRMMSIRYAVSKALAEAGLGFDDISSVSASCIGADWPFEYEIGIRNLRDTLGVQDVCLYNDCIGALRGGTEMKNRDCAILCLGTGANCAVQNRDGDWYVYAYYMKGEHQGASALGSAVFQAVYDAEAGFGPKTLLTDLLLENTGDSSVDELLMRITTGRTETEEKWQPSYKDYGPMLFQAVRRGDKTAYALLDDFCKELVKYIVAGAKRLSLDKEGFPVVLSGGVPKGGAIMGEMLEKHLLAHFPKAVCIEARFEPVVGALLLAYDRLYRDGIPEEVQDNLEKHCAEKKLFRQVEVR